MPNAVNEDAGVAIARCEERIAALEARISAAETAAIARADASDKAVAAQLTAQQAAVAKAENASEKRFESVNEFRQTLGDQARQLMPRLESEAMHKAMLDRHNLANGAMSERVDRIANQLAAVDQHRQGKAIGWQSVVAVIALIVSILAVVSFLSKTIGQ